MIEIKNEKQETKNEGTSFDVKVTRAAQYKENSFVFDVVVNGVNIYGLWFKQGKDKNGNDYSFIDFPSQKGKDGKYYNIAWFPISKDLKAYIENQIAGLIGG